MKALLQTCASGVRFQAAPQVKIRSAVLVVGLVIWSAMSTYIINKIPNGQLCKTDIMNTSFQNQDVQAAMAWSKPRVLRGSFTAEASANHSFIFKYEIHTTHVGTVGWKVPAAGLRQRALGWRISLFVCVLVNWITQLNTKRPRGQELSRVDSQKDGMITKDSIKQNFF